MVRHSRSTGPFCTLEKHVSLYPQNGRLLFSGGAGFLLFVGAVEALL
jgi:hypothetical protein